MKRSYGAHKTVCACCGAMVERYDICEVCGWQDDNVQNNDPDYRGGANTMMFKIMIPTIVEGQTLWVWTKQKRPTEKVKKWY